MAGGNDLPFGLCEKYGIALPEGEERTPKLAWELLEERTGMGTQDIIKASRDGTLDIIVTGKSKKEFRQNSPYDELMSDSDASGIPTPQTAYEFNRLNTKHHSRHAKEMGFDNDAEYEKAAVDFFNSDRGNLYYSRRRESFCRYEENTGWFCSSSDGVVHTLIKYTSKMFSKIENQDNLEKVIWKR